MSSGRNALARSIALARLRSQPGVLVAVVLSVLVATTLLATGPVLATALSEGGLRAQLEQAAASEVGVEVEVRTTAARASDAASLASRAVAAELGDLVGVPDVFVRTGTVRLVGAADDTVLPVGVTVPASLPAGDDREVPPRLLRPAVGGATPDPGEEDAASPADPVPVRLHEAALRRLGVAPGDRLEVEGGAAIEVVDALVPVDARDRRWWDDPLWRDGVEVGESFTTLGPIVPVEPAALPRVVGEADPRVVVTVRTLPSPDVVRPANLAELRAGVGELRQILGAELAPVGGQWTLSAPLAEAAVDSTVQLASTRAAVLATVAQVAVLALYTLGLSGRLLRSGREVETMVVRARGATPGQLGRAAAAEGLVVVLPAVLLAPWTATLATAALGRLDLVTGAGLSLAPRPSVAAAVAAAVAGVACLGLLVWPAVTAARRTYASTRGGRGRRRVVTVVQSSGLDLALVVVAGIGIWQLRAAGGPRGGLAPTDPGELDLVLVAAPALGLLAGAVLVLRLVPTLARAGERVVARRRGLVGSLSGWQVARRPDTVSRPTLLLVLGVAIGVLAATYARTWDVAQTDQAAAALGADAVAEADRSAGSLPASAAASTIAEVEGVAAVAPTLRSPVRLVAGASVGTLLAIDAGDPLLLTRSDLAPSVPLATIDVPLVEGVELPAGDRLATTGRTDPDPGWPELRTSVAPVVRDADGLVHQLPAQELAVDGTATELAWSLAALRRPLALLALEVTTESGDPTGQGSTLVPGGTTDPELLGRLAPPRLGVALDAPAVDGEPVDVDDEAWVADPVEDPGVAEVAPTLDRLDLGDGTIELAVTPGLAPPLARTVEYRLVARSSLVEDEDALVPAIVRDDVLAATGRELGDELSVQVRGAPLRLELVGTMPVVPGAVRASLPVVVDVDAVAAARWRSLRVPTQAEAWQLDVDLGASGGALLADQRELATRLRAGAIQSPDVDTVVLDAAARSADPIAVGLLVALALGAVAAVLLALLGTITAAAVSVRERAAEFALLQAVGTTMRQLRWWLAAEVGVVVATGLVAGGVLGAVLVWAVLPTIGLATDGSVAVPAPRVVVPLGVLAGGVAAVVVVFALVPLGLARSVARAHVAEVLRLGEDA